MILSTSLKKLELKDFLEINQYTALKQPYSSMGKWELEAALNKIQVRL